MYSKEGITSFFKGMSFPFYSVPFINSLIFGCNETAKILLKFNDESMTMSQGFVSGALAGLIGCSITTPVELVKCRLQLQYESKTEAYYKGGFDCAIKTIKDSGIRGLYSGNLITIFREVPGYSAQFAGYHFAKLVISKYTEKEYNDLSFSEILIGGGFAGFCCWQASYPQVT